MAQETEYRLRKIQFTKALRGYSCEEVDTYLAYVNDRYATLGKERVNKVYSISSIWNQLTSIWKSV